MDNIAYSGIDELASALRSGETTAVRLAEASLERIGNLDPGLGAIVLATPERALSEARAADERLRSDPDAPALCGIPYAAKDIFDVAGEVTGGGCPVLADNTATRDSAAVARLAASGMVLVAKTRTSPLAGEGTGLNHSGGAPRNPWLTEPHVAGGSSSGSGVAVAAGMVPLALGSDTAGSVRVPAALCGITGLKTTLGQVSRAGVLPLSQSLDTVGPLVRSVRDAALAFAALRGADPADPSTAAATAPEIVAPDLKGRLIIVAEGMPFQDLDPEIEPAVRAAADVFRELGAKVESREMPVLAEIVELKERFQIVSGEAWRNHARTLETWGEDRDWLTDWILEGAQVSDAELEASRAVQRRFQAQFAKDAEGVDALVMPTVPITARPVGIVEADQDPHNAAYLRNTKSGNFLNLCGLSLPCGLDSAGRPVGMQLCAPAFADDGLLAMGVAWQAAVNPEDRRPPLGD